MSSIPIWPGSSSFVTVSASFYNVPSTGSRPTPFGHYDGDPVFKTEADKVADYCARNMGYPIMDVELQDLNFWAAFEEATTKFSTMVNMYNAQDYILTLQGTSTNQNLNKEFQVLELLFAATMMVNRLSNLNIPNIKSFENKNTEIEILGQQVVISLGSKFIGEIVPRILLVRRETLDVLNPVGFTNGANTVSSNQVALAHFIDLSQTSNLGFAANILNHFYQWLQSILNDTIVVEQDLKLLASDVSADNLDRLIPVYFQQHNAYFYVNIINNFVENKKTKAQLIKI
jgi:hypothetical protein